MNEQVLCHKPHIDMPLRLGQRVGCYDAFGWLLTGTIEELSPEMVAIRMPKPDFSSPELGDLRRVRADKVVSVPACAPRRIEVPRFR